MQQLHGGREYRADFATRQTGAGAFSQLLARRFQLAHARLGFSGGRERVLDHSQFVPPRPASRQGLLF
jgi:hypothetical protein